MEYQDSFPPVHQMIAAYFGIKPKTSNTNTKSQEFYEVIYELLNTSSTQPQTKKNKGIRMI